MPKDDKMVELDTSGEGAEINLEEQKDESVVDTEAPNQETKETNETTNEDDSKSSDSSEKSNEQIFRSDERTNERTDKRNHEGKFIGPNSKVGGSKNNLLCINV